MQRGGERGAVAVEFALVLLPLVLLLAGIGDFGLLLYRRQIMSTASRVGARYGVAWGNPRPSAADIASMIYTPGSAASSGFLNKSGLNWNSVVIEVTGAQGVSGDDLTVTVRYTYEFLMLGIGLVPGLGESIVLEARTVMQLE